MDRSSVLSPRAQRNRRKKKSKSPAKLKKQRSRTKSPSRKKKKKKSKAFFETDSSEQSNNYQCLQQMFKSDNNYWCTYFQEMLSPSNRFPLPPQSPATAYLASHKSTKSQIDVLSGILLCKQLSYGSGSGGRGHHEQTSSSSSISSALSARSESTTADSVYSAQMDREMPGPPERLPELDQNFHIYEYALLNDKDWRIDLNQSSHSNAYYMPSMAPTITKKTSSSSPRMQMPKLFRKQRSVQSSSDSENTENTQSPKTPIKEYPSQPYDTSGLKRNKFSQDSAYYSKMSKANAFTLNHSAKGSVCAETMELFTLNGKEIEWLHACKDDDELRKDIEQNIVKLKTSPTVIKRQSPKGGRSATHGTKKELASSNNNSQKKPKKSKTIGAENDFSVETDPFWTENIRNSVGNQFQTLRGLTSIDEDFDFNEFEEFDFEYFAHHNQLLDVRPHERDKKFDEKVLGSDYLSFTLDKELEALEAMIQRVRQENELLHEIQSLEISDINQSEYKLAQLSEMSIKYSNQSLVVDIGCDILKEITEIPQMTNKNEARAQCVEYQASIIDVGKTSCIRDAELWQNTVWCNDDFMSQEKFDINVMKHNRINDNKPRCLYIDLKHKTLTIHDPTTKGKKKDNKVLDEELIKSFNYTQNRVDNANLPDRDIISIAFWPEKQGKNKRHFQGLVQKYVGHRFVTLMKIYITPSTIPSTFKFGQGPFKVKDMFPNRLMDFELPDQFPISFMLNLLHQKYVELALMEKWCWSNKDSSSWMTDKALTSGKDLKSRKQTQMEKLIKQFNLFLKFQGYELVSMMPVTGGKSKRLMPRSSYSNMRKVKTVRTNWLDSKLDQLSVPHILCSLVPGLAEYLHDCFFKETRAEDWKYCEHHSFFHKYSPWLVEWNKLPPSGKNIRFQQAVILIKGAVAAGMFFKPRELTTSRRAKRMQR